MIVAKPLLTFLAPGEAVEGELCGVGHYGTWQVPCVTQMLQYMEIYLAQLTNLIVSRINV